jgi:DNA polymerase-3 subunit epsilon
LYGFFRGRREAVEQLRALAGEHALCPPLLGLEKHLPGRRCFTHQIGKCHGACTGAESLQAHGLRLIEALHALKVRRWPYDGPVGIRDGGTLHVVEGWRYFGAASDDDTLTAVLTAGRPAFDLDIYRLLIKALRRHAVVPLRGFQAGEGLPETWVPSTR